MSIEIAQKAIITTLVIGGLGGGYFALTGGSSGTLLGMSLALGREENTDWDSVATKYREGTETEIIDGIAKTSSKLVRDIKKWCENQKNTYYLGETDKTYKSYSLWCLKEANIETVMNKRNFKWLTDKWDKKLEKYKNSLDSSFIKDKAKQQPIEKSKLTVNNISDWCIENRSQRYKYQGEETERRVRIFCYWTDEQLVEANKATNSPSN